MIRKNRKSICYVMTLALCVTLGSSYVRAEDTEAQGINVAYHTQDEIRAFCAENAAGLNDALCRKSCCQWRLFCRKAI